jgi:hypothetical protein
MSIKLLKIPFSLKMNTKIILCRLKPSSVFGLKSQGKILLFILFYSASWICTGPLWRRDNDDDTKNQATQCNTMQ